MITELPDIWSYNEWSQFKGWEIPEIKTSFDYLELFYSVGILVLIATTLVSVGYLISVVVKKVRGK